MDWEREARTGVSETVFCAGKTAGQIDAIVEAARARARRLLLTRLSEERYAGLSHEARSALDFEPLSGTAILGAPWDDPHPGIGVVAAGTSDLSVAREAARTLAFHGFHAPVYADVGVAGLWRLMKRLEEIRALRIVIAVAGMEGALFSVLAGLVEAPVIAVPTSVGYGVAEGGRSALHAALAGCAPGVVVVNIDNGFGAAVAAIKMAKTLPLDSGASTGAAGRSG